MTDYIEYVIAAYAVFFVVLGWDFVTTRLQIRRELQKVRRGAARAAATRMPSNELSP